MWKKGEKKNQDRKYILPILHQTKFWLNQKTKTAFSIGFLIACEQAFGRAGNFFPQTESLFTG